jgi:UPF0176 protein
MSAFEVAAFYKFTPLDSLWELRQALLASGEARSLCGTILLANEGINGTVAAAPHALHAFMADLRRHPGLHDLEAKHSTASVAPFHRFKVRLKKEIVTMGEPDISPLEGVGEYVDPAAWNALIDDPATVLIDTRNDYEVQVGRFKGAINPGTKAFRQFPAWAREHLPADRQQPIAMYCTGGIRCEKATALVRQLGYENVFHLKGGILKYLEDVPDEQSSWEGSCFVFDGRVGLEQALTESDIELCHGCRHPLTAEDREDPRYEEGVACPLCADGLTERKRASLRERHRQVRLAESRGLKHIGATYPSTTRQHGCKD